MNRKEREFMYMIIKFLLGGMKPITVQEVHMISERREYLKMEAIKVYELGI